MSFWGNSKARVVSYVIIGCLLSLTVLWIFIVPHFLNSNSGIMGSGPSGYNEKVISAADRVRPAVVSVIGITDDGQWNEESQEQEMVGLGSGIIFHLEGKKAFIVTNEHVISGAMTIEIVLTDGQRREAKLIGADRVTDLAVLQVDSKNIQIAAEFGHSDLLQSGDSIIALGNPSGNKNSQTIMVGKVSEPQRTVPISINRDGQIDWEVDLIQMDTAINRSSSGGALVDLDGRVVGINNLMVTDDAVESLGFAIPINDAKPIMDSLLKFGKVKRPFIGVTTSDLSSYLHGTETLKLPGGIEQGIVVLEASGPAGEAGIRTGDLITRLDDRMVGTTLELRRYLFLEKKIGEQIIVEYYREGKRETVILTLTERD